MTAASIDFPRLLHTAGAVLDGCVDEFIAGLGAPSAVTKSPTDFATQVDLDLERRIVAELADVTQIPVHGEEFGGPPVDEGVVWVLDPIDGTYNYSTGMPLTGILLGLLVDGAPTLGLTWLPLQNRRYAAHVDGPLLVDGSPVDNLGPTRLATSVVSYGPFNAAHGGRYPGGNRADVIRALSSRVARMRMTGSTGVDLAYTAHGIFGGAVIFGRHAWDNAGGAALVRAAGGVVTDLGGTPWTVSSTSVVAAAPGLHDELMEIIQDASAGEFATRPEEVGNPQ
ncbi:inositol monophosphatase [Gordonia sp. CPCC 205515]|uniref:inositol monophosphatase family protein n=1 Tax=Gordonia sp. CPCC 205515 TaxID=3140791 RepID=UPI003AF37968